MENTIDNTELMETSYKDFFKLVKQDWWLLLFGLLALGVVGLAVSVNYILMAQAVNVSILSNIDTSHFNEYNNYNCRFLLRLTQMLSLIDLWYLCTRLLYWHLLVELYTSLGQVILIFV